MFVGMAFVLPVYFVSERMFPYRLWFFMKFGLVWLVFWYIVGILAAACRDVQGDWYRVGKSVRADLLISDSFHGQRFVLNFCILQYFRDSIGAFVVFVLRSKLFASHFSSYRSIS